ncbi:MAG: redox-sensing transcriptional repressor Rex [Acidobacteria bacterium]|nr:redox-sensing transcriptional repressor Rex [Acidobacteriota bacterium]
MIPENTLERLCAYRRILYRWHVRGKDRFYSHELAEEAGITAAQVRRDLMPIGSSGTPRNGYLTAAFMSELGVVLEGAEEQKVVLVGAGRLGNSIGAYFAGRRPNIRIVAAFDTDPGKVGAMVGGCPCLPVADLEETVRRSGALVAILTVPGSAAQAIATSLVGAGIRAILNFTAVKLKVPEGVYVDDIDFSIALEKSVYYGRMLKAGAERARKRSRTPSSDDRANGAGAKRILCVDDDLDVIESYQAILKQAGYHVAVAFDGAAGLAEARSHKPDLIILDVMMRDTLEGLHTAHTLREDANLRDVPILMLTAISSTPGITFDRDGAGAHLPVDAFIDKPVAPGTLLATVERLLALPKERVNVDGVERQQ